MGGTKYIYEVVQQLHAQEPKRKIVIVVEDASVFAKKQYKQLGVELLSLESLTSTHPLYWLFLPFFILQNTQKIRLLLTRKRMIAEETVIISSMFPMNVIAHLLKYPHLQLCYEPFAFFYDPEFTAHFSFFKRLFISLIGLWAVPLDKWGTQKAQQVMTLNNTTRKAIHEVYERNAQPVYAGVNTKLFYPHIRQNLKKRYAGKKIIIHSTDYSPVKKTDQMILLMKKVLKKVPTAHLLITTTIDSPQEKKKLLTLAQELGVEKHVEFLGFVPITELPQYYSLATVFVQLASSARSGTASMALPVKEALCCETPAIRPNVGGEDVEDGVSGFLVNPSNEKKLVEKITWLLRHPQKAKKMGTRGRKYISKTYTWRKTANQIHKEIMALQ